MVVTLWVHATVTAGVSCIQCHESLNGHHPCGMYCRMDPLSVVGVSLGAVPTYDAHRLHDVTRLHPGPPDIRHVQGNTDGAAPEPPRLQANASFHDPILLQQTQSLCGVVDVAGWDAFQDWRRTRGGKAAVPPPAVPHGETLEKAKSSALDRGTFHGFAAMWSREFQQFLGERAGTLLYVNSPAVAPNTPGAAPGHRGEAVCWEVPPTPPQSHTSGATTQSMHQQRRGVGVRDTSEDSEEPNFSMANALLDRVNENFADIPSFDPGFKLHTNLHVPRAMDMDPLEL